MTSEFLKELAALDEEQQNRFAEALATGEDQEKAYSRIREEFKARFLDIIKKHREAPVFKIPFPADDHRG